MSVLQIIILVFKIEFTPSRERSLRQVIPILLIQLIQFRNVNLWISIPMMKIIHNVILIR